MSKRTDRGVAEKLDAIYAQLPTIACRRLCGQACGPILLTDGEAARLRRAVHRTPRTVGDAGMTCGYLNARGLCDVYGVRPLICRVYGLIERMSCPHGCLPSRWLSDREFVAIAAQVERIAGALGTTTPDGVAPLGESFARLAQVIARADAAGDTLPPEYEARLSTLTRGLRALHGGRIIGAVPTPANDAPQWIDLDAVRRGRP